MAKKPAELLAFNRGIMSPLMAARVDVPRRAMSASTMNNWVPKTLGPMSLRPGFQYLAQVAGSSGGRLIPFVYSTTDTALIELTDSSLRIFQNDVLFSLPNTVTADVANEAFTTDLTSWTDADEGGTAASTWLTGGYLSLLGDGTNAAKRTQTVTIQNATVHVLKVVIARGPVILRVGSTASGDEYVNDVELETGTHYFRFTSTGTSAYIQLLSRGEYPVLVDYIEFVTGSTGDALTFTTPWPTASLTNVRYDQSGDVVFFSCYGYLPKRLVRRSSNNWSFEDYVFKNGPFRSINLSPTTIAASALTGSVTLSASTPVFRSTHVGALFRADSNGQVVTQSISAQNTFTDPILVEGTGAARAIGVVITGTFSATVTLQRSVGAIGSWTDVTTYTTTQTTTLTDNLDNQTIYYRIGVKTSEYTSGTVVCTLNYSGGSISGIARITAVASSISATAVVLKDFGSTSATDKWYEGAWSDYRGWPSACRVKDARLWFVGKDKIWGSVVDDFYSHDTEYVGDAGPISRSIGSGPVDKLMWLHDNGSLIAGGGGAEYRARASSEEGPMTPTAFSIRPMTTFGSANVDAVKVDDQIVFADSSEQRVQLLRPNGEAAELTLFNPELLVEGVTAMAVQRRPDTRIHCVLGDGTVALYTMSLAEEVSAWCTISAADTDGVASDITDVCVLPGTEEDRVYYIVKRQVNGSFVYYIEKWAMASECVGGTVNKQLDSFVVYSGASTTTITGLSHLEGETVACWADGVDQGTFTVASGQITITTAATSAVTGLVYTANFESTKLASSSQDLIRYKQVYSLGVVLTNTHAEGLQYGTDASYLDDLPDLENEVAVDADGIWTDYNYQAFEFNGEYTVDSRIFLRATAPKPCTVLALVVNIEGE